MTTKPIWTTSQHKLRMRKMSVDEKCVELAEHFLCDLKGAREEHIRELAEDIQRCCEDACQVIEENRP